MYWDVDIHTRRSGKPLERERTPGVDRTTDLFMDVLKRNGVLPEWIQRQKRVRAMTSLLLKRLQLELMMMMMDMNKDAEKAHAEGKGAQDGALVRRPTREAFAARVAMIQSVGEDLAVINSEIATYKCVPVCVCFAGERVDGWIMGGRPHVHSCPLLPPTACRSPLCTCKNCASAWTR